MKKVMIIAFFASLVFSSCKKERVCECVITSDQPGSTSATIQVTVKKAGKDVCDKNSFSTVQTVPAATAGSTNYTDTYTCTLK